MTFEQALTALKNGHSISRKYWADKFALELKNGEIRGIHRDVTGRIRTVLDAFCIDAHDLMANDWEIKEW